MDIPINNCVKSEPLEDVECPGLSFEFCGIKEESTYGLVKEEADYDSLVSTVGSKKEITIVEHQLHSGMGLDVIPSYAPEKDGKSTIAVCKEEMSTAGTSSSGQPGISPTMRSALESFKCLTCGGCFPLKKELDCHMLMHSGVNKHVCDSCGNDFAKIEELYSHQCTLSNLKPYKCLPCGKCFKWGYQLTTHMEIHSGKVHKCETCSKEFVHRNYLEKHLTIHLKEKGHKCQTCGKLFGTQDRLNKHSLTI